MEYFVPVIGAFFGSAGLVSVVTAIINRTQQSRARRFLEDANVAKSATNLDPHAEAVLDQAIATTTLRLAASTFWRRSAGQRIGMILGVSFVGLVLTLVFAAAVARMMESQWTIDTILNVVALLGALGIYVGLGAAWVVYAEQRLREEQVYKELLKIPIVVETSEIYRARRARKRERRRLKRAAVWLDKKWNRARREVLRRRAHESITHLSSLDLQN